MNAIRTRPPGRRERARRPWFGSIAALALLVLLRAGAVFAQSVPASEPAPTPPLDGAGEGRRLSQEGLRFFKAGQYAEALQAFQASYALTAAPGLLYNLAQSHRLLGQCAAALDDYSRYLDTQPPETMRALTQSRIVEMGDCVRALKSAVVPESPPATAPAPAVVVQQPTVVLDLPRPAPPPPARWRKAGAATAAVAAVGLLSVSGYLAWQANQSADQVSTVFQTQRPWSNDATNAQERGLRDQRWAYFAAGGGLLLGALAAWLAFRR